MTWRPTLAEHKAYAAAFLAAVALWRSQHDQAAVAAALAAAGLNRRQKARSAVEALQPANLAAILQLHLSQRTDGIYRHGFADGLTQAARHYTPLPAEPIPAVDPYVTERIRLLATGTTDGSAAAAERALAAGADPWTAAGLVVATAGLNANQAPAAIAYGLAQAAASPKRASGRLDRYSGRRRAQRATMVGWTEPSVAANTARLEAWRYYGDRTGIDILETEGGRPVREWVVDRNPCDECAAMAGVTVGIYETFPGGDPPRHPSCRCWDVLRPEHGPGEAWRAA